MFVRLNRRNRICSAPEMQRMAGGHAASRLSPFQVPAANATTSGVRHATRFGERCTRRGNLPARSCRQIVVSETRRYAHTSSRKRKGAPESMVSWTRAIGDLGAAAGCLVSGALISFSARRNGDVIGSGRFDTIPVVAVKCCCVRLVPHRHDFRFSYRLAHRRRDLGPHRFTSAANGIVRKVRILRCGFGVLVA